VLEGLCVERGVMLWWVLWCVGDSNEWAWGVLQALVAGVAEVAR